MPECFMTFARKIFFQKFGGGTCPLFPRLLHRRSQEFVLEGALVLGAPLTHKWLLLAFRAGFRAEK